MNFRNDGKSESNIIQNKFTSYLQVALRRKKREYLAAKDQRQIWELSFEDTKLPSSTVIETTEDGFSYEFQIQNEALLQALSELSDRERLILLAHVLEEMDFEVLAHEHGLSYKGVSSIYYRLCAKIRKHMGGDKP